MRNIILICIALFLFACSHVMAQDVDNNLIQFSGVVVTADSLNPVSFTNIIIINSRARNYRGTVADYYGFFSFVAQPLDTVCFTAVGFKPVSYVIPDTINDNRYSLIQLMSYDTINLSESVIYPWPSKEDFKDVFVNLDIPDDDITIAKKNIERAKLKEAARISGADASVNYRQFVNDKTNKLYYAGQIPPNNLLNVFAWAQFIKAWKEGKFKTDKKLQEEIKRQKEADTKRWDYDEWIEK
ncbi:MAG: hypothetical protein PHU62_05045 [Bacteroidales bacterium]|jgi:hypothetical protein|nr:hypothetical protein [Bacteroidales bacterium]MDD2204648.1 hypothetical protein [Bacteroidales bacterium]MDD3151330.1 hypothetical protein [Bacteroidales bacterium]MDD3913677.1 hypothetical protein [Bacteroidales bacterium]MDD4633928.1 hypothetical protein [Bacteroidales bacterium]